MFSLHVDNTGMLIDEFPACFRYGDMLGYFFWVRGQFCLLQARRVFCAHFAIFDGLGGVHVFLDFLSLLILDCFWNIWTFL